MKHGVRGAVVAAAMMGAAWSPVQAQDTSTLVGTWSGTIEEGETQYGIVVEMDLDRGGRPVGLVVYEKPCGGVWTGGTRQGREWRFDETITSGRERCASFAAVTLTETGDELEVSLRQVEFDGEARGTLYRLDEAAQYAAAEAAADAADAAAEYLDAPAWCNLGERGIEFGQAVDETWFIDSDAIRLNGRRFAKYGLPRVLGADELAPYSFYADVAVFAEAGADYDPEVIYVLVGAPRSQDHEGDCEYQPYQIE